MLAKASDSAAVVMVSTSHASSHQQSLLSVADIMEPTTEVRLLSCSYWLRYLLGIWIELPLYAFKAQRWQMVCHCLAFEAVYIASVTCLWPFNRAATLWTLLVPLVLTSFALMFGNW